MGFRVEREESEGDEALCWNSTSAAVDRTTPLDDENHQILVGGRFSQ